MLDSIAAGQGTDEMLVHFVEVASHVVPRDGAEEARGQSLQVVSEARVAGRYLNRNLETESRNRTLVAWRETSKT